MVASVEAWELEEDLARVEALVGDLIGAEETEAMAEKTWYFVPSLMTKKMLANLEKEGFFPAGRAKLPQGETVPKTGRDYAVVFKDYFACGLRLPLVKFLHQVLEEFDLQIHHLTPNGFLTLSKFCWACQSYGVEPNLDTFCSYFELQCQPKKVGAEGLVA
jgi:hypothetical protein